MKCQVSRRSFIEAFGATAAILPDERHSYAGSLFTSRPDSNLGRPPHAVGATDAGRG